MLTHLLGLSSSQQTSALGYYTTAYTNDATVRTSLATAETSLTAAIEANETAAIATAATSIGTDTAQIVQNDATANAQLYQTLTSDQQTTFARLLAHMGPGGRFGGPGFAGPGGRDR
jgi:hypothetical protein